MNDKPKQSAKRTHTECLFDICNYCGRNAGAWADQWGDDVIVFGGCWHGDGIGPGLESQETWMPGNRMPFNHPDRQYLPANVHFAVQGDIGKLLRRFAKDGVPKPCDFYGLTIYPSLESIP